MLICRSCGVDKLLPKHFRSFVSLVCFRELTPDQNCKMLTKEQLLAIAYFCTIGLTILRVFFIAVFFITSVICVVNGESPVEKCDGYVSLSQEAVDSLNTTSTFVETVVSSFLIFLLYRWKPFNFKNFLRALPRQGHFWMWTTLWIARIFTNVLIEIIPGIDRNYPVLIVFGVSLSFEFASTTIFACALGFVSFHNVKTWLDQHFPERIARWLAFLYRVILFTYGLRMLALFLYDSFLVARQITRQSEYRELDSILLALDVGYRGSLCSLFFRKFFEFDIPEVIEAEANENLNVEVIKEEGEKTGTECHEIVVSEERDAGMKPEIEGIANAAIDKSNEEIEHSERNTMEYIVCKGLSLTVV